MQDWNPRDYQGRSKQQVAGAYKINNTIIAMLAAALILMAIFA